MLRLPDHWVWDSWTADDGEEFHLFFLRASRALLDPLRRHYRASIGHAVSADLRSWRLLPDALVHSDGPAWDDLATWTGSVVQGPEGLWRLFYTGVNRAERGLVQRIGVATSPDLVTWTRADKPLLEADPRWYERLDLDCWIDEAWRDPFVFADPDGDGWHMLITARSNSGPAQGRGVIGHARSADLVTWEALPPLTAPAGFGQLEVSQSRVVDGTPLLMFSCWPTAMAAERRESRPRGGIWVAPGESLTGPWDFSRVEAIDHPSLYAGQLVQERDGRWAVLGFRDIENGRFVGEIVDPIPVRFEPDGLHLLPAGARRPPAAEA